MNTFLELHHGPTPLLLPNAWDIGSARLMESMGFAAIASTSSGFAASIGRLDGDISRSEALEHLEVLAAATSLPVNADFERGFADGPADVAESVTLAAATGIAGLSIEDSTGDDEAPIFAIELATERIQAAAEAAHAAGLVLVGRAENFLHGYPDLADTITRLQSYQEAGADVLYAPGLKAIADIRAVVTAVDRPVNVLAMTGCPSVAELAAAGVARISVGGAFAFAAFGAVAAAAQEFLTQGTYGYLSQSALGKDAAVAGFSHG